MIYEFIANPAEAQQLICGVSRHLYLLPYPADGSARMLRHRPEIDALCVTARVTPLSTTTPLSTHDV